MILWTFQETEWSTGGGPISWVSDFVAYEEVDFGEALQNIEVTIFSNPELAKARKGLRSKLRQFGVRRPLDVKLPSVVYLKKEKKLRIKWQSQNLTEDEMEALGPQSASTSVFVRAVQDVYDALDWGLNERLSGDDFDISGCLGWVKDAQAQVPSNDAGLRSILSVRSELYLHLVRTNDFHKRFDIDWTSMHEDAAYLLYHRDLWNDSDVRMPHGNALGKGILENFACYEEMSIDEVLSSMGLKSYGDAVAYDDKVKAMQVELALVFAYIKKRGMVHQSLADELIRKMVVEAKNKRSFWVYRSKYGVSSHFSWMCNYLETFTSIKRRSFP